MWQQFSEAARQVVHRAQQLAIEKRSPHVEAAHLFLATLPAPGDDESTVATLLQVSGVTREEAELYALAALETRDASDDSEPELSRDARQIIRIAFQIVNRAHQNVINPEHLFIACIAHQRGPHLGETLRPLGLDAARLKQHLRILHASKTPYKAGNPLNSLTQQGEKAIEAAHAAMRASFCGRISTSHLLLGLLSDENFASVTLLQDIGADLEDLKRRARESIAHDGHIATPQKKFSPGAKRALERAAREAKAANHHFIGTDHLLLGLLPREASWREKIAFGSVVDDPTAQIFTETESKALRERWSKEVPRAEATKPKAKPKTTPSSWINVTIHGMAVGFLVAILIWNAGSINFSAAYSAFFVFILALSLLAAIAQWNGRLKMRDHFASVIYGLFIGIVVSVVNEIWH